MATVETPSARATRTQRRTRIQREKESVILDAALDIFSTHGFAGTTVDQLAAAAGMSKPNLLYYFARKDDVYSALLERQVDDWTVPLNEIREDGEPLEELRGYIRRKLTLSRMRPRESRLYAMEIIQGAPRMQSALDGEIYGLVREKSAVIEGWMKAGKIAAMDATHLIFAIWATTQHYADFYAQVHAVTGEDSETNFRAAQQTLEALFLDGLRLR